MTTASRGRGALSRFAHFAGMSKPRAEETATTDDVEKVEDKIDDTQEDVEDLQDKVDDLEERVEDVEDDQDETEDDKVVDPDEPPADKPEARAAYRKGVAKGRKAERARAGAIMSTKVAAANPVLAMHLAFETAVPPKSALQTMRAAQAGTPTARPPANPPAPAGGKLDNRMDGKKRIDVGAGAPAAGGPDLTTPAGVAAFVAASAAKARGQKK